MGCRVSDELTAPQTSQGPWTTPRAGQQALPVPTHLHTTLLHPREWVRGEEERDTETGGEETEGNQEEAQDPRKRKEKGSRKEGKGGRASRRPPDTKWDQGNKSHRNILKFRKHK